MGVRVRGFKLSLNCSWVGERILWLGFASFCEKVMGLKRRKETRGDGIEALEDYGPTYI